MNVSYPTFGTALVHHSVIGFGEPVHGEFALMQPLVSDTVLDNVVAIDTN
jgi:hypothetical protein